LVLTELLREHRVTTAEAAALLQVGERDARIHLASMVERGLLEGRGAARSRSYHLSAGVYRALQEPAAYVRVRGFEPLQQEQMVLSYVDAHGRITRSEAADLCQLEARAAGRLLRRIVDRGELVVLGERRGAYYERLRS
ncbi:MAG: AAA family ATPase, partial [Egibacteraceae bacterium]